MKTENNHEAHVGPGASAPHEASKSKNDSSTPSSSSSGTGGDWKAESLSILKTKPAIYTIGILLSLVVLRVGANLWLGRKHAAIIPTVSVTHPIVSSMDKTLDLPCDIEAISQASIYAHVSGYLKKIYVDEGDHVKKGQLLAEIDAPDIVQEYRKAQAEFNLKDVTRKRYTDLLTEKVVSQQEFDTIDAEANEAKSRLDNASANMDYTRIRAPFDGSIARRNKYPGDLIIAATKGGSQAPIFILVNESQLRVAVNVPQIDLARIKIGFPADVRVDAFPKEAFHGTVSRIDALLDESTKTQRVLIDLDNKDHKLRAGMFANISLHMEHKDNALTIPKEALQQDGDNYFAFVVKNGKVAKAPLKLGMMDANSVEVTEGLSPTDQVISQQGGIFPVGTEVEVLKGNEKKQ